MILKNKYSKLYGFFVALIFYIPYIILCPGDDPLKATYMRYLIHILVILAVQFYFFYEVRNITRKLNHWYYIFYWANGAFDLIFDILGYFWYATLFLKERKYPNKATYDQDVKVVSNMSGSNTKNINKISEESEEFY